MPNSNTKLHQNSSTACRECRTHKLKCSRDLPVCTRCARHSIACHYPAPPDRKALAKSRAPWGAKKQLGQSVGRPRAKGRMSPTISSHFHDYEDRTSLPSKPLGLHLLETLFSHYISAPVIFNKNKVINEYLEFKLPEHAAQAMFALASIFIGEPAQMGSHAATSNTTKTLANQADNWASLASQHCLLEAHRPSLDIIQSNEILSTFWFAKGDLQRAKLHSHAAYLAARALGYQSLRPNNHGSENLSHSANKSLGARCFWNCWVITFIIIGDDLFTMSPSDFALPAPNTPLNPQIHTDGTAQRTTYEETDKFLDSIQLFHIYHGIQTFRARSLTTELERSGQFVELEQRLKIFGDAFPQFRYTGSYQGLSQPDITQAFFIHSLYNLSMISLHSFFVPLFTGRSANETLSPEFLYSSTKTSIYHADIFVDMIHATIYACENTSHLPPFTGYCSFVVASIFASLLGVQDAVISAHARSQLISCLVILDDLQKYWAPLKRLWQKMFQCLNGQVSAHDLSEKRRALHSRNHDGLATLGSNNAIRIADIMQPSHAFPGLYQFPYVSHQEDADCEATLKSPGASSQERTSLPSQDPGSLRQEAGYVEDQTQLFMHNDKEMLFGNNWDDQMLTIDPNWYL